MPDFRTPRNTTRAMREDPATLTPEQLARFWAKVSKSPTVDGCWEWTGARMGGTHNYGQMRIQGTTFYAHRISFEIHHGSVPDGMQVCHHCDHPPCVRPDHLFAGTAHDNTQDMVTKGRNAGRPHPGSSNGFAKLTEAQVEEIRARYVAGARQTALAAEFGVTQANISVIVRGDGWKHIAKVKRCDEFKASVERMS